MIYFANPCSNANVLAAMESGELGYIDTPRQQNYRPPTAVWCADNGAFGKGFREDHWWAFLVRHKAWASTCRFATAPDVVGDAKATLERSAPWFAKIRELGYPVAFVAQDGIEDIEIPWDDFDCLFIGGTDFFKLGPIAAGVCAEAKARGKWLHIGRVNSRKRWRIAEALGADSCDGTFLRFNPEHNLNRIRRVWWGRPTDPCACRSCA